MTFNLQTSEGRHGELEMKKLEEAEEIDTKVKFKKFMGCMECAEDFSREDVGLALYYYLQLQAEEI